MATKGSNEMTAAETTTPKETELERIELWRSQELERAGFKPADAVRLAARLDIDLHYAVELVRSGCPHDVALQILL
jgi:predicted aconitase